MGASSVTHPAFAWADFRKWAWWRLAVLPRWYVGLAVLTSAGFIGYAASQTTWRSEDLIRYSLLLGCGVIAVVAKPGKAYELGGLTRDFLSAWVLTVAIALPPFYALVTPIPLQILTQLRIQRGVVYRRAFTVAVMGLSYGAASLVFRAFPASFAGSSIGSGRHALTWVLAVVVCEILGGRGNHLFILGAIKLSDPSVRLRELVPDRKGLQADLAESDLGVLITIAVGVNVVLALVAVPTVLLIRRFMMHEQLLAQSRIDTKTGLLNSSTWEAEAKVEVIRAIRTRSALSVALIDIDHFKAVNDTHGHLVGDTVLRAVTDAIQEHLRGYDRAGRFGGEEFVVLLPHAREADAVTVAERLRTRIAAMSIPVAESAPDGKRVRLTVSVGVAALNDQTLELNDLMAAADAALYHAKQTGRNRTCAAQTGSQSELSDSPGPAAARRQSAVPTRSA